MKFTIPNFTESPLSFMRECSYACDNHAGNGELSCMRRLAGYDYPRFHAYVHIENTSLVVNLHLDQKKPSYGTAHAHSGDYDGNEVTEEAKRIMMVYERKKGVRSN